MGERRLNRQKEGEGVKFLKGVLITLCLAILVLCLVLIDRFGSVSTTQKTEPAYVEVPSQPEPTESETYPTAPPVSTPLTADMTEQEILEYTFKIIKELSVSAGDEEVMQRAKALCRELSEKKAQQYELLSKIIAFADGVGDAPALLAAADKTEEKTVKQAAVSCWAASQKKEDTLVFSFVGDCTFARFNEKERTGDFVSVYESSGSTAYPFDNVRGVFSADDITAVNFEGVLTDSTQHENKQFYFRGKKEYAKILSSSSVEAANLANNHTLDYKERGFEDTVKALENEKIGLFWASEPYVRTLRTDSGTISVVMLSTSSIDIKNQSKFSVIKKQIERYKAPGTIIIVNLHWGSERAVKPSLWQTETAHELVDAGADLIVGHHPHVLQGIEKYKDAYIAYSLGNFAFAGNSMANQPETIILRAVFQIDAGEVGKCRISAIPCYTTSSGSAVNDYKPSLQYGEEGQKVIDQVLARSAMLENGITELSWHNIG